MGLYSKDTGTKIYLVEVDGANAGLKVRRQYIKESKLVEVSGMLRCGLVISDCLLLNSLKDSTTPTRRQFCMDG